MTIGGTAAYEHERGLPPLVEAALDLARSRQFDCSCLPSQGRLLQTLVRGRRGATIGETGTGYGVGLAWIASAVDPESTMVSVDRDEGRARDVAKLFAHLPNVTIVNGDWSRVVEYGPFDVLVVDGGGAGKNSGDARLEPRDVLRPGGTLVLDDFSPRDSWPPTHNGAIDEVRVHWLEHPDLFSTEVQISPDSVTLLGSRR